jgi:hypothetical protein
MKSPHRFFTSVVTLNHGYGDGVGFQALSNLQRRWEDFSPTVWGLLSAISLIFLQCAVSTINTENFLVFFCVWWTTVVFIGIGVARRNLRFQKKVLTHITHCCHGLWGWLFATSIEFSPVLYGVLCIQVRTEFELTKQVAPAPPIKIRPHIMPNAPTA